MRQLAATDAFVMGVGQADHKDKSHGVTQQEPLKRYGYTVTPRLRPCVLALRGPATVDRPDPSCLRPPASGQLKGVSVGLAVAAAALRSEH